MGRYDLRTGTVQLQKAGGKILSTIRDRRIQTEVFSILSQVVAGPSYGAEYQAVLDNATSRGYALPTSFWQARGDQLIKDIGPTRWAKIKLFRVYHGPNTNFIRLNWKNPNNNLATLNNINFVAYSHTKGQGINGSFIDENFIPFNEFGSVLGCYGMSLRANTSLGNVVAGGSIETSSAYCLIYPAGTYYTFNSIAIAFLSAPSFPCLLVVDRYATNSQRQIVNGVQINDQASSANSGIGTQRLYTHGRNNNGGSNDFNSDYEVDLVYVGDSMSVADHLAIYNAFQTFKS